MRAITGRVPVAAVALLTCACEVPIGNSLEGSALVAAPTRAPRGTEAGGGGDYRLHVNGSRGLTIALGAAAQQPVDGGSLLWRVHGGAGYAFVPRPFESPVGWEALGLVDGGDSRSPSTVRRTVAVGARLAALLRLSPRRPVWSEDRAQTAPVWFLVPYLGIETPVLPPSQLGVEASAGLGIRANFYDLTAP